MAGDGQDRWYRRMLEKIDAADRKADQALRRLASLAMLPRVLPEQFSQVSSPGAFNLLYDSWVTAASVTITPPAWATSAQITVYAYVKMRWADNGAAPDYYLRARLVVPGLGFTPTIRTSPDSGGVGYPSWDQGSLSIGLAQSPPTPTKFELQLSSNTNVADAANIAALVVSPTWYGQS